jgi:hypothetical protein
MCCIFTILVFLGARAAILVWWLFDPTRWNLTFDNFWLPFLGFLFLPWTLLMYVLVFPGGIDGFDWLWLGLAVVVDIASYGGGAYGNRNRIPGYAG